MFNKKSVVFFVFMSLLLIIFSGCSNFLNGSDLTKILHDQIDYENARECTVLIKADSGTGSFFNEGEKTVKEGYSFDLQFTLNSGWILNKFVAVSSIDKNESRNDCVEFSAVSVNESESSYSCSVKLLKVQNDIRIMAECVLIPYADFFPQMMLNGVPQDTNIVITFNTPVKTEYFYDSEKNTFKNIEISSGSISWIPENDSFYYFLKPELSADGLVLTIPANKNHKILTEANATIDIVVVLHSKGLVSQNNLEFEKDFEWSYRINSSVDSEKPSEVKIKIFRNENKTELLSSDSFSDDWSDEQFLQNHAGKNIFIDASGYDAGGGVRSVYITETLIRNSQAENVEGTFEPQTYHNQNIQFVTDGNYYSAGFSHTFVTAADGILKVEISLADAAGNRSDSECFYVVKDTTIDTRIITLEDEKGPEIIEELYSDNFYYYDNAGNPHNIMKYAVINDSFIRIPDKNIDTVTFKVNRLTKTFYNSHEVPVKYEIFYGISSEESKMSKAEEDSSGTVFTIRREKKTDTFVIIRAFDQAGNTAQILRVIPHSVNPTEISYSANEKYYSVKVPALDNYSAFSEDSGIYCVFKTPDGKYCIFPKYSSKYEAVFDPTSNAFYFNPYTANYYDNVKAFIRETSCHTGKKDQKVLATRADYENFMPSGQYEAYLIPYITYGKKTYFGCRSIPIVFEVTNDGEAVSYKAINDEIYEVPMNKWEQINAGLSVDTDVLPSKEDVNFVVMPGDKNSGKYKVCFTINSGNPDYDYSLYFNSQSHNLEVNLLPGNYKIYLRATDENGNYATSDYYFDVNCTGFDVTPPKFVFESLGTNLIPSYNIYAHNYTLPSGFRLFNINGHKDHALFPSDETGLMKDENGNTFIEYYFIYLGSEKTTAREYSDEELLSYKKNILTYNPDDLLDEKKAKDWKVKFLLPYDGIREGYYELLMKAYDAAGNSKKAFGIISTTVIEKDFAYSNDGTKFKVEADFDSDTAHYKEFIDLLDSSVSGVFDSKHYKYFIDCLDSQGNWQEIVFPLTSYSGGEFYHFLGGSYKGYFHASYDLKNDGIPLNVINNGNSFVKINTNTYGICSYTEYVLPDYYNPDSTADYSCNMKNIVLSSSTTPVLSVLCDAPAFVHTLCSSRNLSDLAEEGADDEKIARIWSSKGIEVCDSGAIVQKSTSFSYKIPVKSETIEKGMWYTTIAHFADGSTLMTAPKQK